MTLQNRTKEYLLCVQSCRETQPRQTELLPSQKSSFTRHAAAVSLDIAATYTKLQKLAVLARQKSIFEDKPKDINDLIQEIKVDISRLQRELSTLQVSITPNPSPEARQHNEHSKIVINSLQSKIVDYSNSFKSVLQTRYENMQQQKSRREEYSMITPSSSKATAISDSPLYHPEKRTNKDTSVIDFGQSFEQQQLLLPNQANMEYIDSRSQAIESIESTIQELGQIFQNFNVLLQGQREMVQRIDDNVMDVSHNTEAAHTQLIKFYQGMSGNQALMVKVFGLIMAFFVLFVMMT